MASGKVHDCVPVGSHGVAWEAKQLASTAGLRVAFQPTDVDLTRSGGPATCVVMACAKTHREQCDAWGIPERPLAVLRHLRS